jgi:hypothetical protein
VGPPSGLVLGWKPKVRVGFLGFTRFRVLKNDTQDLPDANKVSHSEYPTNRIRVIPNNPTAIYASASKHTFDMSGGTIAVASLQLVVMKKSKLPSLTHSKIP